MYMMIFMYTTEINDDSEEIVCVQQPKIQDKSLKYP